ncbi:hypothetical protein L227DRAFT_300736 [Lentinus tigrinus ALCF2SS1-6]|uniref:Uncharacterized protein n=1 Tax=Lentinus tigrinus ALCF2SS1-6 TaxID=1328759 RepID=A0A5C2RXG7_9APHY|nr:hypothetical protein L227DRAFT_300736 [Lentinus tigrinus ALCF2SS1-6]
MTSRAPCTSAVSTLHARFPDAVTMLACSVFIRSTFSRYRHPFPAARRLRARRPVTSLGCALSHDIWTPLAVKARPPARLQYPLRPAQGLRCCVDYASSEPSEATHRQRCCLRIEHGGQSNECSNEYGPINTQCPSSQIKEPRTDPSDEGWRVLGLSVYAKGAAGMFAHGRWLGAWGLRQP